MTVFEEVKSILAERLEIDVGKITEKSSFVELQIDSLDTYEMLYEVEQRFQVAIDDSMAQQLTTVGKLVEYIEKAKN
jgi:acyl carrier protein